MGRRKGRRGRVKWSRGMWKKWWKERIRWLMERGWNGGCQKRGEIEIGEGIRMMSIRPVIKRSEKLSDIAMKRTKNLIFGHNLLC
jgi:hypothetical protein